jgi:SAM-dependent methyltransferase
MEDDPSSADYADTESLYNQLMAPALERAIAALGLRPGWHALDAGCGPGGVLARLCASVAPTGNVLGLDYSVPHVERARQMLREQGLEHVATVEVADLRAELPVAPQSRDAVWAADVLYPDTVGDPGAVVARLAHVLMPEGVLAIFYGNWLRPIYLPGYARLEHLICAARELQYQRERPWQSSLHPERPLAWLEAAGLVARSMRVLPVIYTQPLPHAVRQYVTTAILRNHYANAVANCGKDVRLTAEDESLWRRLSDPASPDFILDQPDYYCVVSPLLAIGYSPS